MTQPPSEHLKAYAKLRQDHDTAEHIATRERFVQSFVRFAGSVVYENAGRGTSSPFGRHHQNSGSSKSVPVATAEDSPQMGASITAYFSEFHPRQAGFGKERLPMREVTGAAVYVGALLSAEGRSYIYGGQKVLHVVLNPELVLYRPEGADRLTEIEPTDTEWGEITDLVAELEAQREALDNGHGQSVGWIS